MEKEDLEVIRMVRGNPRRSEMLMDVGIIVPLKEAEPAQVFGEPEPGKSQHAASNYRRGRPLAESGTAGNGAL